MEPSARRRLRRVVNGRRATSERTPRPHQVEASSARSQIHHGEDQDTDPHGAVEEGAVAHCADAFFTTCSITSAIFLFASGSR